MLKKIFGFLLIFATLSLMVGQDFNSQLNSLNEKYDINIQESTKNTINSAFGFDVFETINEIFNGVEE